MARNIEQTETAQQLGTTIRSQQLEMSKDTSLVIGAGVLMAISAHISVPLFFSPVPITMQPLAMLLIAFFLGPRRASLAMLAYLLEGISGLPVFSPAGPGGIAQLAGPTGGFLMATPFAAFAAGSVSRRKDLIAFTSAAVAAEAILFAFGASWFAVVTHATIARAFSLAVLPFLPGEVLKVAIAVSAALLWNRRNA